MRTAILFLAFLLACTASLAQYGPAEILPPSLLLELSDNSAEIFRETGQIPNILQEIDLKEPGLHTIFYVPKKEYNRKLWYEHGLNRWFRLEWSGDEKPEGVYKKLSIGNDILSFSLQEPHYALLIPDDYNNYNLWWLDAMNLPEAWDLQTGDENVIVCTIDTGCDVGHDDLWDNIYCNMNEDSNENGIIDWDDLNEIDDDDNGFIDDLVGWDFVSETNPPGEIWYEDYGPPDCFVLPDIHGHGTHVAGTAGAVTDNDIGVAAASWNVSNMILRAGFAYSFGQWIYGAG